LKKTIVAVLALCSLVALYDQRRAWAPPVILEFRQIRLNLSDALVGQPVEIVQPEAPVVMVQEPDPEPCHFDSIELDFSQSAIDVEPSPENDAYLARKENNSFQDVIAADIGRDPQFVIAYPEQLSNQAGSDVRLRYAQGFWGEGSHLQGYVIVDAVTNKVVNKDSFESEAYKLAKEPCYSWYRGGCRYPNSLVLPTSNLAPGAYYVFLSDDLGAESYPVFFNISPDDKSGKYYDVLAVLPEFTWQSYNRFGGGSLYSMFEMTEQGLRSYEHPTRLYSAALDRPFMYDPTGHRRSWTKETARVFFRQPDAIRYNVMTDLTKVMVSKSDLFPERNVEDKRLGFPFWMQRYDESPATTLPFVRLLDAQGYRVTTITQGDLNQRPELLEKAKIVLFSGHHEYWTSKERSTIEAFIKSGGNVLNFAGNVNWGQVALHDNNIYIDQIGGVRPETCQRFVSEWFDDTGFLGYQVFPATERLTGLSYRFGGYPLKEYYWLQEKGYEAYGITPEILERSTSIQIKQADHPVFADTGLKNEELWDGGGPLLSVELDGAPLTKGGDIDRRFSSDFPEHINVLAVGWMFSGNAVNSLDLSTRYYGLGQPAVFVDTYPFGHEHGRVLSFGSIGYATSLHLKDKTAEKILINSASILSDAKSLAKAGEQEVLD